MKMHMNACRGGACVRAVILCLLAVFCLSLVSLPVKAGPPMDRQQLLRSNRDTDDDPWVDVSKAPAQSGDILGSVARQVVEILALVPDCTRLTTIVDVGKTVFTTTNEQKSNRP